MTLVQELEVGQLYYLDLIEEELAFTCWRQYTEYMPDLLADQMMERKSTVLSDYLQEE